MKIFIDTAHVEDIKKAAEFGLVDGVTTNPTLVAKEVKPHKAVIQEIAKIVKGPVSVEVNGTTAEELVKEAEEFAKWAPNVVVKIPMTKEGIKAVRILAKKGIKTNVTLVFSSNQALIAAKAGASFVSPFIGRLDDIGEVGMDLIRDIVQIYRNYGFKTEIIVASIRNPVHVVDAAKAGAHIATIPANVLELMWKHPLTDIGIEKFKRDYEKTAKL
ncbi:MAG: fructose-6-phosphate aldolase [Candidatus Micrarchaeota archaeon]|nr:fructose-6-phosphate aldolase [Candidatus Micrarchaeota archaeon]